MAVRLQWQSLFNGNSVAIEASQDLKNIFADNSGPDAAD
jgi:hypothetical protein